jgi:hypothetical protein
MGFFCLVCANLARMAKGTKSAYLRKRSFSNVTLAVSRRGNRVRTRKDKSIAKATKAAKKLF